MSQILVWFHDAWQRPRQQFWMAIMLLSAVSLVQYAPSLSNDFIWDGKETFLNDPSIRDFSFFPSYFTGSVASHLEKQGEAFDSLSYYRPAVKVLHLFEYKLFGENPLGYHAVSVILNLCVVLLAFLVVRELTQDSLLALVASLFFAVNPSHVEAISWAYSDSYPLFSVFVLLSLFLYLKGRMFCSLAALAVALFSQESAILLPVVLVLERLLVAQKRMLRDFYPVIPFVLLVVVFLVVRSIAVGGVPVTGYGIVPWLNAVTTILATSVKIFFVPDAAIALYHNRPGMFEGVSLNQALIYLAVVGLLVIAIWLWRAQRHVWLFWYAWFFVWLVVMFNVGEFAFFYFMDKILYLASLGFCVLLAKTILEWRIKPVFSGALIASIFVTHFSMSLWRDQYYTDEKTYFEKAVEFSPAFPLLRYATGMMYQSQGDYRNAEKEFKITVKLEPTHSYAHNNIGNILYLRNDFAGAIEAWRQAVSVDPSNPQPYYNIGATYERQRDFAQAVNFYQQFLARQPNAPAELRRRILRLQQMQR